MLDQAQPTTQIDTADQIEDVLDLLIGDYERTGSLHPNDLARLASKRELTLDQIDEIAKRLGDRGIDLIDESIPETFDAGSCDDLGLTIPKLPLLTPEQEKQLGHSCRAAERLLAGGPVPNSAAAAQIIAQGADARRKFIVHNLRLVAWVANKYRWTKLDFADLFQEGMFGLMRAVTLFDPTLGYRFSTYATWWIEQSVRRGLDNTAETIRIPVHMLYDIRRYRRMAQRLRAEFGSTPTLERLSSALEWPLAKTAAVRDVARLETMSLDVSVSEDGRTTLGDVLPDGLAPSPENALCLQNLREEVERVLSSLTPREERILRLRFGIGVKSDHTLEEVGQQFSVTRERIRQIEAEALRRLKHPSRSRRLRPFLDLD